MPTAKELYERGELKAAIDQLISEVKAHPTDTPSRTFLFGLLCFAGELDRAGKQLDVIATQSVQAEAGVMAYRNCLQAERDRRALWASGLQPHFLEEPPAYVDFLLDGIAQFRAGNYEAARVLLDTAEDGRPAISGRCDGTEFYDLRDADDFVGSVLEVAIKDQYTWIPFEQLRSLEIAKPTQLRDLIYPQARIESLNGSMGEVFLLALYAGSSENTNDQVRLGRLTEWQPLREDLGRGFGMRLLMLGDEDKSILDVTTLEFDVAETDIETDSDETDAVEQAAIN